MDKLNFKFDDYEPRLVAKVDNFEICLYSNEFDGQTKFTMHVTCWEEFWNLSYEFVSLYEMLDGANKWYQSYRADAHFLKMEQVSA